MLRTLIFTLLFISLSARAELYSNKINFQHVLDNRDVVLGVVLSIKQDQSGFMWFGGENGLVRFDGYDLKVIEQTTATGELKPAAMVVDLYEDKQGILWAASGNGLLKYDPKSERLTSLPDHASVAELPISSLGIRKVTELPDGRIATVAYNGLFLVDRNTGEGVLYRTSDGLSAGRINTIAEVGDGYLWIGTASGFDRLDLNSGDIKQFKPYALNPDSVPDNGVAAIEYEGAGVFWLGTDNGLIRFEPDSGKHKRYKRGEGGRAGFSGGDIWDLHLDQFGFLWIATDGGGLNLMDVKTGDFVQFKQEGGRPSSLNSNVIRTVTEDKTGDIWVGNYPGGVNFFDRSSAAIMSYVNDPNNEKSLSYNSVMSVVKDQSGNLWVGTDAAGLNYFDLKEGTFTRYPHIPGDPNTVSANAVLSMLVDSKNILWGGTWAGGVFQVDLNNNNIITRLPNDAKRVEKNAISQSKKLNNDKVWTIYEDRAGFIWIGTHEGGLSRFDRNTGQYTHYVNSEEPGAISGNQVWTVYEDSSGTFWVGTTTGLGILNRETGKFDNFKFEEGKSGSISNPSILSIFEDSQKRMWFGTASGLNLLDKDTRQFKTFGITDGFYNDAIRSIVEDRFGRLWLGTNSGVTTFDPDTNKVKNYNRQSGKLVGGFNYNAAVMTENGDAVFGGKNGLKIYQTEKMQENKVAPLMVFTDLKVLSDSVKIGEEGSILQRSVNFTDSITLDYTDSVFEFQFSALNYRDTGKNRYAYKLEGFDENWVQVGDQRRAKYTNLDSGRYTFKIKGSNNDGVWSDESRSIDIIQLPPPWQTWWAYTLYMLSITAIVLWFIHAQRQKRKAVEEQNRLLEIKVAERTAEITQKNKDIESMLANMQQGLFTIEQNGLIHPEYSKFLESIFETENVAGRNVLELLFGRALIGSDVVNQVQETIYAVIGEDEMNYEFNSHLLVDEYDIQIGEQTKNLSVDWNPIVNDDCIDKLMVTVRDVTELKKMQAESAAQQKEIDIISQLLNVSAKKYLNFEQMSIAFIEENRSAILLAKSKDQDVVSLLFRNMHTIKGNCRTYGFSYVGNVVHEAESVYSALKSDVESVWDPTALLQDLNEIESVLAEYGRVYREVLGRSDKAADRTSGIWLNGETLEAYRDAFYAAEKQIPNIKGNSTLAPVRTFFVNALSSRLDEALKDVVESLPLIAEQLGKTPPAVQIESDSIRIRDSANDLLNNVFAHVLRNSVDHGLESLSEREQGNKPLQGTIRIRAAVQGSRLNIRVADDGRGLHLSALKKKGLAAGLWREKEPTLEDLAELIFESGVSTKEEVTDISGRGVGMDAVKQFLLQQDGDILLELADSAAPTDDFAAFETVIVLPARYFIDLNETKLDAVQNF